MARGIFPTSDGLDLYNRILSEQFDEEISQTRMEEEQEIMEVMESLGITKKGVIEKMLARKGYTLETKTNEEGIEEYWVCDSKKRIIWITPKINEIMSLLPSL